MIFLDIIILVPMGDGIALMRQLSAGPSVSSVGDEDGVQDQMEIDEEGSLDPAGNENDIDEPGPETFSIQIPTLKPLSDGEAHLELSHGDTSEDNTTQDIDLALASESSVSVEKTSQKL